MARRKTLEQTEILEAPKKTRFLFLKISFIFLSLVLSLVLVEVMLRIFTPEPENLAKLKSSDLFLYENKPNASFHNKSSEYDVQVHLNSSGFRDDEFATSKDPNVLRIAVLGDSQEEALQMELPDTWQKVMARRLTQLSGKKVETYNFGVSGYGTDQEWLTLREKVWQYKPDMVILAFSPNDVGDTFKNKLVRLENGKLHVVTPEERAGGNFLGKFLQKTYIYNLVVRAASGSESGKILVDKVRRRILGFPKEERFFLSDAQLQEGPFEVMASKFEAPSEVSQTWDVIRALISDMKVQSEDHGAKFMVVVSIPRAQVEPDSWVKLRQQYFLTDSDASPYQINDVMGKITKELNVFYYDDRLDAVDWTKKYGILHLPIDAHFNINGNRFMGTKTADFIIANKLFQ